MAYELDPERGVAKSIRRAYRKTLKRAHRLVTAPGPDDDPVHDGHTAVKKARMLLRLARGDLGRSRFKRENGALRDAGHALSGVRDAVILVEALDGLIERASEEDRARLAPLRAALVARREDSAAHAGEPMAAAARALNGARGRASAVTFAHRGWKAIAPGLDAAYRRGKERLEHATATGSDQDLHALRKTVKDLGYQMRFLRAIDPGARAEEDALKRLGALLGDDHDLAVLAAVSWGPEEHADPAVVAELRALAAARQAELRKEAMPLAAELFAEAPEARLDRLSAALRQARARVKPGRAAGGEAGAPAR